MGKNHRHKKRLKAEKSKTQLKTATKFLPKGQNVTKTDFKIKPIVIQPQLQGAISAEDGKKDLNLKDVLSRMKHYNENMKIKACEDLEHIIKYDKIKLIGGNIPVVIQHLSEFIQTKWPKARKAGLTTINTFLKNFTLNQIAPYFHYFSVNLRCAMTHIDRNIQEDSIHFFDSFLINTPQLIGKHSAQIFPDFISLVSKLRNENDIKRTISLNLNSKFTSLNWRIIVFSRLYTFMESILSEKVQNDINSNESISKVTFNATEYENRGLFKPWDALFRPKSYVFGILSSGKLKEEVSAEQNFLQLIPLLHETWLEGCPSKHEVKGVTFIMEEDTAILLNCVVKVFHLLWLYLSKGTLKQDSNEIGVKCEKLIRNLAQNLPYNLVNRPKLSGDKSKNKFMHNFVINDVKCTEENLMICYLFLKCCNNLKIRETENVVEYIRSALSRDYKGAIVDVTYLFMILNYLLIEKNGMHKAQIVRILEDSISLFEKGNLNNSSRNVLFKLLGKIEHPTLLNNDSYQNWLENSSKLLLENNIHEDVVNSMFDMSRKNKTAFNRGFFKRFSSIYCNLEDLRVTNSSDPDKIKMKILDILFYIPNLEKSSKMNHLDKSSKYWKHVESILNLRKEFNVH